LKNSSADSLNHPIPLLKTLRSTGLFPSKEIGLIIPLMLALLLAGCGGGPAPRTEPVQSVPLAEFESLLERGKTYQARAMLEPYASPEQPNSIRGIARLALGRCELAEGQIDDSIRHLDKARRLLPPGPEQARAHFYLGVAYLRNKSVISALNHLEVAFAGVGDPDLKTRSAYLIVRTLDELGDPVSSLYRDAAGSAYFKEYSGIWSRPSTVVARPPVETRPKVETPKPQARRVAPPPLRLLNRQQWSARPVRQSSVNPMTRPFRITVHHTADQSNLASVSDSDPREYLKTLQRHCQNNLDWGDIGYHYLISKDGRIWEGRPMKFQGAHAGNPTLNRGNIGVALIGNFDQSKPSTAQIRSLQNLLSSLCMIYEIPPAKIFGHGDLKTTGCPGKHLSVILRELVRKLESRPWARQINGSGSTSR
jgi:hypothetical protein